MIGRKMEAQYAEAKGELLLEGKAKTTTRTVEDFTIAGIRQKSNFEGEVKGRYNARTIATTTSLLKPDGTAEYEGREIDATSEGDIVLLTFKGKGQRRSATESTLRGEGTYTTQSKKLASLNGMKVLHEGTFNPATGEVLIKIYAKGITRTRLQTRTPIFLECPATVFTFSAWTSSFL